MRIGQFRKYGVHGRIAIMTKSEIEMMAAKIRALDPKTKNIVLRFICICQGKVASSQSLPEASPSDRKKALE